jgi:succinate dehydrogenase / fumarate reductase cytochrome b subunit
MSESSPGRIQRLLYSSIGAKFVMGLTGVILVGFVLVHMLGNLQVYMGPATFNSYAQFLKGTAPLLWGTRITLLVAVALHIWAAVRLTRINWAARPQRYAHPQRYARTSYAALFMRASGTIVLAFIIYHLLHFTIGVVQPENFGLHEVLRGDTWVRVTDDKLVAALPANQVRHDAYSMFVLGFQNWIVAASYIVANLLLARHLSHGVVKLVNPANKRKYKVLVVGTGLAGRRPPRRWPSSATRSSASASRTARAARTQHRRAGRHQRGEELPERRRQRHRLFYDTVKGGDFRAREANVYRLAEVSVNIIDQCVAQGVPFAREYGGCSTTAASAARRSRARSTRAARPASSCCSAPTRR